MPATPGLISTLGGAPTYSTRRESQWSFSDVGIFDNKVVYTFEGDTLPDGLTASDYVIAAESGSSSFNRRYTPANVLVSDGFLNLLVPGEQSASEGEDVECAEVTTTISNILYASVRTEAIFSDMPGTCHGNFFYHDDNQEIDIEYLTDPDSISRVVSGSSDPIFYVNQAVTANQDSTSSAVTAPASDITTRVHEYRTDWTETYTAFYFDGELQKVFTDNVPTKAGSWIWNNWSNGDKGWSCGPPEADNVFKIQKITMYYNTSEGRQ